MAHYKLGSYVDKPKGVRISYLYAAYRMAKIWGVGGVGDALWPIVRNLI